MFIVDEEIMLYICIVKHLQQKIEEYEIQNLYISSSLKSKSKDKET